MNHLILSLMLLLLISACGKTGALYLPDEETSAVSRNTAIENLALNNREADGGSL